MSGGGMAGGIMQLVGMGVSSAGSYYDAKNKQSSARFQASMADTNAKLAELDADAALEQGNKQAVAAKIKAGKVVDAQKVGYAASGIDLASPTVQNVMTSTQYFGEEDALQISSNAMRQAMGAKMQAVNYRNQSTMLNAEADSINPKAAALTSLLGGAGDVASSWYGMNKNGTV